MLRCEAGRVAVEVGQYLYFCTRKARTKVQILTPEAVAYIYVHIGAAIGMVAMYLATRGLRVYELNPKP